MDRKKSMSIAIVLAIVLLSSVAMGQIKYPVTSDVALGVGTVVTIDGTDANKIIAADGPIPTAEVIGIITAVQNIGGVDFYLVKTEGYLELSGATFTPGTRLTSNGTGQIVASTSVKDVLVGIAVSGTRVQILINDPKIDDIFDGDITITGDLTVEGDLQIDGISTFNDDVTVDANLDVTGNLQVDGDGYFDNNIYVEDTTFTGHLDVEFDATVGGDIQVDGDGTISGDLTVEGEATFDSFATFNDSVYFEGPIGFGDDVEFSQGISQSSRNTLIEFGTAPLQVITPLNFAPKGDVIKLVANLILSDEYSITPNYNGAKITVELYDVTNSVSLKSYTVFLQDRDWYEIKEVSISHVISTPAVATEYTVRCYADGWGNGGRVIQGDLSAIAIQH